MRVVAQPIALTCEASEKLVQLSPAWLRVSGYAGAMGSRTGHRPITLPGVCHLAVARALQKYCCHRLARLLVASLGRKFEYF